eukprot:CAMPEP_0174351418 /NCGR_PEP_ID=MMETSP0811_2-20130205/8776_1 /TAXON_ID=73025 ORGANISM="Eutreptiella gymnastica-like, Strain CCMP1594" /NCGR_SAMPLE_ID=MMETSP0811_2 /ASSEMBLY_ACC=CAM_ASM_000667 /LENGTH=85 /DNA_ID=CAMNT_0015480621 /DNA_START=197 /DNA_END=451 /DNA_ORIENTATION=-
MSLVKELAIQLSPAGSVAHIRASSAAEPCSARYSLLLKHFSGLWVQLNHHSPQLLTGADTTRNAPDGAGEKYLRQQIPVFQRLTS